MTEQLKLIHDGNIENVYVKLERYNDGVHLLTSTHQKTSIGDGHREMGTYVAPSYSEVGAKETCEFKSLDDLASNLADFNISPEIIDKIVEKLTA